MGLRLLIIVGVIWFALRVYRRYQLGVKRERGTHAEKMVQCAVCGVYLPEPEARREQPGVFHCPAHQAH